MIQMINKAKNFPFFWAISKWSELSNVPFENVPLKKNNTNPSFYELVAIICQKIHMQISQPYSKFGFIKREE
jgi:hypothetical protein